MELKTLKDIQVPYPYYNGDEKILRDLIKEEEIKWVKKYHQLRYVTPFVDFFNISEEDLK